MSYEIQTEPPRRLPKADLDEFPNINIRKSKSRPWVRHWLIGTTCFLAGVISHGVLNNHLDNACVHWPIRSFCGRFLSKIESLPNLSS
jgi:hypothetical protein